ncbi:hypothetical protein B9Z55_012754 [Caenorhabditis nigoni]|uniref:F-box domain-containing protein n=1 Tax=Caenorhabditis nigoni TaxID=1611254 RepID=A0A2G5TYQ3_9PELO|nr:hypothetical protein B9Z55_012754 [Caenorhabditis nigoni]
MSFDIGKLAEKTESLSIDPIYNTNWCDMPDDIKLECIGKMEFRERLSLRCTAKAERSLVDLQKIKFSRGSFFSDIYSDHYNVYLASKNGDTLDKEFKNAHRALKPMKTTWKIGVFENFFIASNEKAVKKEMKSYNGKISAKNINLHNCDNEMAVAVLQKMNPGVESITMDNYDNIRSYPVDKILKISVVQNASYWQIKRYHQMDILHKVTQMWIDNNSKIGFTFQVFYFENPPPDSSFEEFSDRFANRIV